MISRQSQKGGDDSNNLQVENLTVINGIDEKRAREICQEMYLQVRNSYSKEALELANSRIAEFENKLMPKMEKVNGALEAFADPSFQMLLVDAQKTAACTERTSDYELLSELLIHRFQKGENRITRTGVSRAVEVVDKIADDALLGLTVFHAVRVFVPSSPYPSQGLNTMNDLFGKLLYGELPIGNEWLEHLDILDAMRINSIGQLKKLEDFYIERLPGYIDVGIEKKSENYFKAIEILNDNELPNDLLVDHEFNKNFLRLIVSNRNDMSNIMIVQHPKFSFRNEDPIPTPLSEKQIVALNSIYDLYKQDQNTKQKITKLFLLEWNKKPNLKIIRDWWNNIACSFDITSVGKILAHSNAQRCDKKLPPLN